jgi:hypothetical protein
MAPSVDSIPPPQLPIAQIADRVGLGLEPADVVDQIIDYLLAGDRSRWLWVYCGPGWFMGQPPLSRMPFEDYLDHLERTGLRQRSEAEFMPWARQRLARHVLLEAHELVGILQALELRVTPWVKRWLAEFSPWSTPDPPPLEAMHPAWYELNGLPLPSEDPAEKPTEDPVETPPVEDRALTKREAVERIVAAGKIPATEGYSEKDFCNEVMKLCGLDPKAAVPRGYDRRTLRQLYDKIRQEKLDLVRPKSR